MPDDASRAASEALRHHFSRLDKLLQQLNDGNAWPSDALALADVAFITEHAKTIEASLDEIARIVALVKGPPRQE